MGEGSLQPRSDRVPAAGRACDRRLRELPGYGEEKAKIFLAILAKRLGKKPAGWEAAAAPFSDDVPRSVADVASPEALLKVREFKKAQKAAKKSKADAPAKARTKA